jgi:hypothetical protein
LPLWLPHKILKRNPARQYCDSRAEKKKKKKGAWQTHQQNLRRFKIQVPKVRGQYFFVLLVLASFVSTFGLRITAKFLARFFTGEISPKKRKKQIKNEVILQVSIARSDKKNITLIAKNFIFGSQFVAMNVGG